jgi:hypothetical protein
VHFIQRHQRLGRAGEGEVSDGDGALQRRQTGHYWTPVGHSSKNTNDFNWCIHLAKAKRAGGGILV